MNLNNLNYTHDGKWKRFSHDYKWILSNRVVQLNRYIAWELCNWILTKLGNCCSSQRMAIFFLIQIMQCHWIITSNPIYFTNKRKSFSRMIFSHENHFAGFKWNFQWKNLCCIHANYTFYRCFFIFFIKVSKG